jgi:4-hydroxyphenylacetate 3-monooxygenase
MIRRQGTRSDQTHIARNDVVADEVFVTTIQPMRSGEERYAMSFAIPMRRA